MHENSVCGAHLCSQSPSPSPPHPGLPGPGPGPTTGSVPPPSESPKSHTPNPPNRPKHQFLAAPPSAALVPAAFPSLYWQQFSITSKIRTPPKSRSIVQKVFNLLSHKQQARTCPHMCSCFEGDHKLLLLLEQQPSIMWLLEQVTVVELSQDSHMIPSFP